MLYMFINYTSAPAWFALIFGAIRWYLEHSDKARLVYKRALGCYLVRARNNQAFFSNNNTAPLPGRQSHYKYYWSKRSSRQLPLYAQCAVTLLIAPSNVLTSVISAGLLADALWEFQERPSIGSGSSLKVLCLQCSGWSWRLVQSSREESGWELSSCYW